MNCRVCGSADTILSPLQCDAVRASRLLEKLFEVAKLKICPCQNDRICFKCIYKIEDTNAWLNTIRICQSNEKCENNKQFPTKREQCTQMNLIQQVCRDHVVKDHVLKEDLTLNFSFMDEDIEGDDKSEHEGSIPIPNAQQYVSDYRSSFNSKFKSSIQSLRSHNAHRKPSSANQNSELAKNTEDRDSSRSFSFLTPAPSIRAERKQGNFIPKQCLIQDKESSFEAQLKNEVVNDAVNFDASQINFSSWNLGKTTRDKIDVTPSPAMEDQKRFFKSRAPQIQSSPIRPNGIIPRNANVVTKGPTTSKGTRKRQVSTDMFASSQDSNNGALSAGWQLSPDEDIVKRARMKLKKDYNVNNLF